MISQKFLMLLAALMNVAAAFSLSLSDYPLIPTPKEIRFGKSAFRVASACIDMPEWEEEWAAAAGECGFTLAPSDRFRIVGRFVGEIPGAPSGNEEAYRLLISKGGIEVEAATGKGIYWALQTFRQIAAAGHGRLPECEITDWPAFPWRGFMIDTGRSYVSVDELERQISVMSQFKLNVFHWHLTDNQAWRLESRIFPMLNDSVNMERQPGRFYTLDEARALVDFAKAHNVLLLPEIDMPGHSAAFRRTFRHDMQSPEGMKILKLLVDEVCSAFDVPYLHIGTDEVAFTNDDFVPQMVEHVRANGKKVASWNPGWTYKEGEIDLTTMWSYRGHPTPGVPAVDMRFHYINHFDPYADLVALFRSNIYGRKEAADGIVGVEIGLWTDRYVADEASMIAQNSVYTAMLAVAERSWQGGGEEYFDILGTNLNEGNEKDFADFVDFENRLLWHKDHTLAHISVPYVRQSPVRWLITDAFPNHGDLTAVFPPETEGLKERYVYGDSVFGTSAANGATVYLRHYWGQLIPGFYPDPKPDHTAYAFTWVYAPEDMEVGLQAETQNYSRSESDLPPPPGKWDYRESRILVNGQDIPAPEWTASHNVRSNEIPLGNENFPARKPIRLRLNKGWNSVLIKLPVGKFSTPETRLVKWMFTFVLTTPDGLHAAPGLIYSPLRMK